MVILNLSSLAGALVDLWIKIISVFNNAIENYAWSIIILTIVIKIVMSPLDFFNKKTTRKNSEMQAKIQPELANLQKKYGHDKALYNQKVSEVYKSHNYNVVGSCLFMLINLVLTLVIFISLLSGLNQMASTKIVEQYDSLKLTYEATFSEQISQAVNEEEATKNAQNAVAEKYKQIKYDWLWIDNVWKSDTPTSSIPNFNEYINVARSIELENGEVVEIKKLSEEQKTALENEYNKIMDPLRERVGKPNGYLVLVVLIIATAFLSQWLMQRKMKGGQQPGMGSGKIMMFVLPIILGFFALSYNAVFALYLLTSQVVSLALTPAIDSILNILNKKSAQKTMAQETVSYKRKDIIDIQKVESQQKNKKREISNSNKTDKK